MPSMFIYLPGQSLPRTLDCTVYRYRSISTDADVYTVFCGKVERRAERQVYYHISPISHGRTAPFRGIKPPINLRFQKYVIPILCRGECSRDAILGRAISPRTATSTGQHHPDRSRPSAALKNGSNMFQEEGPSPQNNRTLREF